MRIVVLDGYTLAADGNSWAGLDRLGAVEIHDRSTADEVRQRARGADILITNKAPVSAETIANAPELRCIAVSATGYDCVAVAAASRRGIAVCHVPEYGTRSVAQFTLALLLELCHRVGLHTDAVQTGEWSRAADFCFWRTPQVELAGKTLGLVGFGRIGRCVGEWGHALGMAVRVHSRTRSATPAYQPFAWAELDEVFRADVIALHCPLTPETAGLVNRERLRLMRPEALLINTARGGLVVEADLAEALNEGRLAGAAVDVASREPIRTDNPLLTARNCLITPHIAWATREARRRLLQTTIDNVASFLAGEPRNVVNR